MSRGADLKNYAIGDGRQLATLLGHFNVTALFLRDSSPIVDPVHGTRGAIGHKTSKLTFRGFFMPPLNSGSIPTETNPDFSLGFGLFVFGGD